MKKLNYLLITLLISFLSNTLSAAQSGLLDMGIFNAPAGNNLEIRIKANGAIPMPIYTGGTFVIRYPASYIVDLSVASTPFGYILAAQGTSGGFKYFAFSSGGGVYNVPWVTATEYPIAVIQHTNDGSGYGIFELVDGTDAYAVTLVGGEPLDVFYQELSVGGGPATSQGGAFYAPSTIAALPVELTNFNANPKPNRTVLLDWKTAAEINLSHYEIEHSTDGNNFGLIGKTNATAAQNLGANYTYVHANTVSGDNFYRLRMVDRNGAFEYSPIRVVRFEDKSGGFSILPNPSSGPFILISEKFAQFDDTVFYQVFDKTGRLLQQKQINSEKMEFDLSEFPAGGYNLIVRSNQEILTQFQLVLIKN